MSNTIKPKRSYTLSTVPSGLAAGELAINASSAPKVWIGSSDGKSNVLVASLSLSDMAGSTTNITEGSNLYYTDARARAALSSSATGLTYTSGTGAFSLTAGYAIPTTSDQTNWDSAYTQRLQWDGGSTNLVTATARTSLGLVIGTNVQAWDADLDAIAALAGTSGLLKKTAANTWSLDTTAYGAGTVTSISTTSPITGGTITGSGTIGINASSANTASYVVQRDASGNFSAGTITANLTGTASNVTTNANLTGVITSVGNATSIASQTGTGSKFVVDNSPTLVTPVLGVATATSINKVTITTPATGSTLTVADGKTLTSSNTLTFTGTDSSSVAFGAGGTVLYSGGALGTPSSGTLTNCTFPILNQNTTGNSATATSLTGGSGGTIPYQSAAGTTAMLANGTSGQLLQSNGGTSAPSWVASPGVPTGSLFPYAGSSAPTGYLLCNGAAVSRSTYATLFGILSTTYGSGDGSTTFNVPDLRGRFPMGAGTGTGLNASGTGLPSGTSQTARTAGQWGGEETHQLTTAELASHTHANTVSGGSTGSMSANSAHGHLQANKQGTSGGQYGLVDSGNSGSSGQPYTATVNTDHTHTFTPSISNASAGSDSRHNTIPPFVVLNYIIKT